MGVMGTTLTYYHCSLVARGILTCGTQHVHLSHHDSLLQPDFFPPQLSVKKLIQGCLMWAASVLLFQELLYIGEKVLGKFTSAQKVINNPHTPKE